MPPVRFEPTISGDDRQQTYALGRVAIWISKGSFGTKFVLFTAKLKQTIPNEKCGKIH
jgi:hypothetical protein